MAKDKKGFWTQYEWVNYALNFGLQDAPIGTEIWTRVDTSLFFENSGNQSLHWTIPWGNSFGSLVTL